MANDYTFLDLAKEVLEKSKLPLSINNILANAKQDGLIEKLNSKSQNLYKSLRRYLERDIKNKESKSNFIVVSRNPTLYFLKEKENLINDNLINEAEIKTCKESNKDNQNLEREMMHPLFVKFANGDDFKAYCKTIYHEKSTQGKKGQNRWLHPDIVGVYFPFNDNYEKETLNIIKNTQNNFKLYSFELKLELSWNNLKECYFQTVSNSSWANEGYLVVYKEIDEEIKDELRRLNASFGIGVIELEKEEIFLPSKQRELDIDTINELVGKNPNFRIFMENVGKDCEIADKSRINNSIYDNIKNDEKIDEIKSLLNKKLNITQES
ncbi:MAG: HTH domain-containing protein [Helicobacteraceae bacterium]|nr:HTH domain-containing protein [Helicobacteraceae bacterium]